MTRWGTNTMDTTFLKRTRHKHPYSNKHTSKQQKHNIARRKQENIQQQAYQAPRCAIFVCDRQNKNTQVKGSFCPTHDMLGDFFTKAIQGNQFVHMRNKILTLPGSASTTAHRSVLEKCAEKSKI